MLEEEDKKEGKKERKDDDEEHTERNEMVEIGNFCRIGRQEEIGPNRRLQTVEQCSMLLCLERERKERSIIQSNVEDVLSPN